MAIKPESSTQSSRSGKQPQKFPTEARWTEYVWQRPQPQLPSLRNYIDNQDRPSRGTPPPRSAATPHPGSGEPRARNRDSYGQYECVAIERLDQVTFLGLTQADANETLNFRHSMRISDEPGYHSRTGSSTSLAGRPREGLLPRSRPDSAYFTDRAAYPTVGTRDMPQHRSSQSRSEYERTYHYGGGGGPARSSYVPDAEQNPFQQRRQQLAATPSDSRFAHYAGQPAGNYTWDAPGSNSGPGGRKRRGNLPKESTSILNDWFNQHAAFPYPKEDEKQHLQALTGLSISQVRSIHRPAHFRSVFTIYTRTQSHADHLLTTIMEQISNWFINARRRRRPDALTYQPPPDPNARWR